MQKWARRIGRGLRALFLKSTLVREVLVNPPEARQDATGNRRRQCLRVNIPNVQKATFHEHGIFRSVAQRQSTTTLPRAMHARAGLYVHATQCWTQLQMRLKTRFPVLIQLTMINLTLLPHYLIKGHDRYPKPTSSFCI